MSQVAILFNGLATCIFGPKNFKRLITLVDMQNPSGGTVTIYKGLPSGAFTRVTSNVQGANQQWTKAFSVPKDQGLFVQWTKAPSPVSLANARISWLQESSEGQGGITDRRLWSPYQGPVGRRRWGF